MIRIFIGYDDNEKVGFSTLSHSLLKHSTQPISITPIRLKNIKDIFVRERVKIQSTEFAFSRFLVPYLCNYSGHAIFMDCDMLARADISLLWRQRTTKYAVQCVQHDYTPNSTIKFMNQPQTPYPKKNWSSMMIFNNAMCRTLTPDYVSYFGYYLPVGAELGELTDAFGDAVTDGTDSVLASSGLITTEETTNVSGIGTSLITEPTIEPKIAP